MRVKEPAARRLIASEQLIQRRRPNIARDGVAQSHIVDRRIAEARLPCGDAAAGGVFRVTHGSVQIERTRPRLIRQDRNRQFQEDLLDVVLPLRPADVGRVVLVDRLRNVGSQPDCRRRNGGVGVADLVQLLLAVLCAHSERQRTSRKVEQLAGQFSREDVHLLRHAIFRDAAHPVEIFLRRTVGAEPVDRTAVVHQPRMGESDIADDVAAAIPNCVQGGEISILIEVARVG
ncbi:hypothetical protein D3C73_854230 [compost metagenome]